MGSIYNTSLRIQMNLQNKDIKKIKNCINFAIQNNKNLVATDIDDLKEITSLLYFFQLENQKNN